MSCVLSNLSLGLKLRGHILYLSLPNDFRISLRQHSYCHHNNNKTVFLFLLRHVQINLKIFWPDVLILCLEIINIFHVASGGFGSFGLMNIFWKEDYKIGLKYQSLDSSCIWWMMVLGWIYFSNFPININTALISAAVAQCDES